MKFLLQLLLDEMRLLQKRVERLDRDNETSEEADAGIAIAVRALTFGGWLQLVIVCMSLREEQSRKL